MNTNELKVVNELHEEIMDELHGESAAVQVKVAFAVLATVISTAARQDPDELKRAAGRAASADEHGAMSSKRKGHFVGPSIEVPMSACLGLRKGVNGATGVDHRGPPRPGTSRSACTCGHIMAFAEDLSCAN